MIVGSPVMCSSSECQMVMSVLWARLTETDRNWRHVYKVPAFLFPHLQLLVECIKLFLIFIWVPLVLRHFIPGISCHRVFGGKWVWTGSWWHYRTYFPDLGTSFLSSRIILLKHFSIFLLLLVTDLFYYHLFRKVALIFRIYWTKRKR